MEVHKTLNPGQPGTRRFLNRYGERLVAVRYRKDLLKQKSFTTIELIVDQRPLTDGRVSHAALHGQRRSG